MTQPAALLEVRDLGVRFHTRDGVVQAVNGVSFRVQAGETLGLVGESGSGKSVLALSILRLLPAPAKAGGEVLFRGVDLLRKSEAALEALRGREISMIFQEPMTALNPVMTAGAQIAEAIRLHARASPRAARERTIELLAMVGIPAPAERVDSYPHELSGGMRQRVMIAMALALRPALLIADEPTTALDVTVEAQILALLARLRRQLGMSLLLITHDLGVVAGIADRVAVMVAGRIVETAPVADLFARPLHPYTQGLLHSLPRLGGGAATLAAIPGAVPDPLAPPPGCAFHPRCPLAEARCQREVPALEAVAGRTVACFRPGEVAFRALAPGGAR